MASLILQGGYYNWSFTNGGNTYTSANIVSGSLTDGIYQECGIGNCIARQLNLRLWNVTLDTSSPIVLTCTEVSSSGTTTNHNKGTYLIDTVSTSPYSEYTEVTAFDAMLKSEVVYIKEGEWTATTDYALVTAIASTMGVSVSAATDGYFQRTPITIDQAPSIGDNGTTCRQILSTIGALRGGNFIISDSNALLFVPLFGRVSRVSINPIVYSPTYPTTADYSIVNEVVEFDKSDAEPIVGIEFQANGGQIFRAPSGLTDTQWEALDGKIIQCNLPFMASQEAVNAVWATYENLGISYIPYKANSAYLDPWASLGYIATIKDTNVYVSNRTISIDHLATSDLNADTTKQSENYYPYISPQVREARQKAEENYAAITVLPTQIMSEVYTKGETDQRIASQVTQSATEITTEFTREIGDAVGEANQYTDQQTQVVRSYITEFDDGTNVGIALGRSDSPFKAKLTNEKLSFTGADGTAAAWVSNNQLYINEAVINTDLKMGRWVQQVKDGHFQIRYI